MAKKKFTVDIDLDGNDILNCPRLDTIESDIAQEVTDRTNADSLLQTDINNVASDLSTHELDTNNPHAVTLEQARSQNSSLSGDINANTNTIINIRDAVNPQEPITKSQFDSYNASVGRQRGAIDCSSNPNYPASNVGDRWEVTVSGKIGGASGITVQVYDEIVCKTQSVAGDQATVGMNFYVVQGNLERASETVSGYTQYATDAEVQAGTENTKTFTPLKLTNWWSYIKGIANTWALKQTFTTAPRLSSNSASTPLAVDSNKDVSDLTDSIWGAFLNGLTGKTTPVDTDSIGIVDSADSNKSKKLTFTNLKAFLKTYFDTLYRKNTSEMLLFSGSFAATNLAASTTYYFGNSNGLPAQTTQSTSKFGFANNYTITKVVLMCSHGTNPSSGNTALYIRENATTDKTITTSLDMNTVGTNTSKMFVYSGLSLSVSIGTDNEVKIVTPAMATSPTNCRWHIQLWGYPS